MTTNKEYRSNGAIGALLDEYEKALSELIFTIKEINHDQLSFVVDIETKDDDCRSIQTILTHVIQSGYTYVIEIRKWLGESMDYQDKVYCHTPQEYQAKLVEMFSFTEKLFTDHPNIQMNEYHEERKIITRWGQTFDVEQLMQHAIVHILRHRRQIERFKQKISC